MDGIERDKEFRLGLGLALATYGFWGCFPLYFKVLNDVPVMEILMHRILWSSVFTFLLLLVFKLWPTVMAVCRSPQRLIWFFVSASLIAANWLLFVYGVVGNEVLELSLGYFINPMFNVFFGVLLFKERLSFASKIALTLVLLGLMCRFSNLNEIPYLAIGIALVFSLYGAVRKLNPIDSISGLFIESAMLSPIALIYLYAFSQQVSIGLMQSGWQWAALIILAGPLTSLPLIGFSMAVKRIPYYLVGFCQYITPTVFMAMAVFIYGEAFSRLDALTFIFVWLGIAVTLGNGLWQARAKAEAPSA